MDTKLFIFGATLLLSCFISHNRALILNPNDLNIINHFIYDVEEFHIANVDREKFEDKISQDVMECLYTWESINHNWSYYIYLLVSIGGGVDSRTNTSAANGVPLTDDHKKASELIREFTRDLELADRPQLNATRFNEIVANKLRSPVLILTDLLKWKASKDAMLETLHDFIMADGDKSEESSRNIWNFMNRQFVLTMSLRFKSINLPIPVNTTAFEEKANNNPTKALQFINAYEDLNESIMLKSIYSIVVHGSEGMNSTNYMKDFVSRSKVNYAYWLFRNDPFPLTIAEVADDLLKYKWTMDMNIELFESRANIDPALTTLFLNFYSFSTHYNIFHEMFSIIVYGAQGMNSTDYMEYFLLNNNDAASRREQ